MTDVSQRLVSVLLYSALLLSFSVILLVCAANLGHPARLWRRRRYRWDIDSQNSFDIGNIHSVLSMLTSFS